MTERITVLTSPALKASLHREAERQGVSLSALIRSRCELRSQATDESLVVAAVDELQSAFYEAKISIRASLDEACAVLEEMRAERSSRRPLNQEV